MKQIVTRTNQADEHQENFYIHRESIHISERLDYTDVYTNIVGLYTILAEPHDSTHNYKLIKVGSLAVNSNNRLPFFI